MTSDPPLIRVYEDLAQARRDVLGRRAAESLELPATVQQRIREVFGANLSAEQVVARIVADVRAEGDEAVRRYTREIDGVDCVEALVPPQELDAAVASIDPFLRGALEAAAERVRAFHERSKRRSWLEFAEGGALGQMIVPIERVGVYAPGGRAAYPSTVLMAAVPARVAGVKEVVLATPPGRDGTLTPSILAAARIAGVDSVYRMGGAQAIAALAYGTQSIRRVDKIVGPGNVFVVLAKRAVAGAVGIDGLPGPTETVVLADETANPAWLAADMMAQAEHDPMAQSILICTSLRIASAVLGELERQLAEAPRADVIREAFGARGAIVVADSVDAAIQFANEHAPEHLCLSVADAWSYLGKVRNAGGVFVGEGTVEAIGDYTAGPSHIMPTGGTARFASPLNLDDFTKVISVFSFGDEELRALAEPAIVLARAEGLSAHSAAIEARLNAQPSTEK
ncbi:MAG: histidinol dehydrogenase [Chloroflexi bacterium]|nr:histidinol dehydrogenase [Chloroflexota bacterium]